MVRYDRRTAQKGRSYIDDRRGQRAPRTRGAAVGGAGGLGLVGILAFVVLQSCMGGSGIDLSATGLDQTQPIDVGTTPTTVVGGDPEAETVEYMGALMADIQEIWDEEFQAAGLNYEYTQMVLFTGGVSTGCGNATSAVGPFYCPAPGDHKVYIDLGFYDELRTRFGAPGDFAQAYVVAHEVGHHLQSVLGISDELHQLKQSNPELSNEYSVRQELQADCFAGVWANLTQAKAGGITLEQGDIAEGLAAAAAVGDDRIQSQAGMTVDPEVWTHGSAEARQTWFDVGYRSGDPNQCDPYSASAEEVGLAG